MAATPGAFVVGVEYRKETSKARPDANLIAGNSIGFGGSTPIDAKYDVKEAYAELKLPLVSDMSFVQVLNLEGGVRKYRKTGVEGKSVSVQVDLGGRRYIKKKTK